MLKTLSPSTTNAHSPVERALTCLRDEVGHRRLVRKNYPALYCVTSTAAWTRESKFSLRSKCCT